MGASASSLPELNFLMIGKTGNGKSSTANSILKNDVFKISNNMTACTKKVGLFSIEVEHEMINLVDTPGLADTVNDVIEDAKFARQNMTQAFKYADYFHAILLILRYQDKEYTKEDISVTDMMKAIFGSYVLRKHCIIVMTHGDNFVNDAGKIPHLTFESWCKHQQGAMLSLINECQHRIVLINNKGTEEEKEKSLSKILQFTRNLKAKGNIYSIKNYNSNEENRNKLILTVFLKRLNDMFEEKLQRMYKDLELIISKEESMYTSCKSVLGEFDKEPELLLSLQGKIKEFVDSKEERPRNSDKINAGYAELKSVMRKTLLKDLADVCLQFSKMEAPMELVAELRDRADLLLKQVRAEAQGTSLLVPVEMKIFAFQKKLSESVRQW